MIHLQIAYDLSVTTEKNFDELGKDRKLLCYADSVVIPAPTKMLDFDDFAVQFL